LLNYPSPSMFENCNTQKNVPMRTKGNLASANKNAQEEVAQ